MTKGGSQLNALKMCLNPKVLAGLAVVAVGLFVFAPNVALAALPFLVALACPLSMAAMALFMGRGRQQGMASGQAGVASQYSCPMHPQVQAAAPGPCPQCGMPLVSVGRQEETKEERLARLQKQLQQVQGQQAVIAAELEGLQTEQQPRAIQEAESVARKAEHDR